MERARYFVVEGPIGVGKTTLARTLVDRFQARGIFEVVEEIPFLAGFYQDRDKLAFQTQLFFLLSRFTQQQQLGQHDLFAQVTDANATEMVKQGPNEVTRAAALYGVIVHGNEMAGTAYVYLRSKNIVPPSTENAQRGMRGRG